MKKRKLQVSDATGRIIEKEIPSHFETADELIALIHEALSLETFKGYHDEGLIIVDNLEAVSIDDRRKIKHFIEAQTPPEMQFLLTSRNSEEYESNTRLCGFESEDGKTFVHSYIEENALDVRLEDSEINELLDIAKGNTLVLALSLRRISQKLIDMSGLRADFSCANVWKGIRKNMAVLPPNAYESISDFMFKDSIWIRAIICRLHADNLCGAVPVPVQFIIAIALHGNLHGFLFALCFDGIFKDQLSA